MMELTRRRFVAALAASGVSAATAPTAPAVGVDMRAVHTELRPAVAEMMKQFGSVPDVSAATLAGMRKMMAGMAAPLSAASAVRKHSVPGQRGRPDVTVYAINAQAGGNRPAIIHTHGGGFVMGDAASGVGALQLVATALDCVIITVDDGLAPETTYAGSIEYNYAALSGCMIMRPNSASTGAGLR